MRVLEKLLKVVALVLLLGVVLFLVAGAVLYSRAKDQVYAEYTGDPPSVLRDHKEPDKRYLVDRGKGTD
jgi:hypothetical protein